MTVLKCACGDLFESAVIDDVVQLVCNDCLIVAVFRGDIDAKVFWRELRKLERAAS